MAPAALQTLLALLILAAPAAAQVTHNSVTLRWTSHGDDGDVGRAASVDIRYSTTPITASNFNAATRFATPLVPAAPGQADSVLVTGLQPATAYYFAVKIGDEVPNWSALSNTLIVTTAAAPDIDPPAGITDLRSAP